MGRTQVFLGGISNAVVLERRYDHDLSRLDHLGLLAGNEIPPALDHHPDMVPVVSVRRDLLPRLHTEQVYLPVLALPDGLHVPLVVAEFLQFVHIQYLCFHAVPRFSKSNVGMRRVEFIKFFRVVIFK